MPRDDSGIYTKKRSWISDAVQGVPFSPVKWEEQDDDFANALNDLPLKTVVPTYVEAGTDPNTVNPASIMEDNGITYICIRNSPTQNVWKDLSSPTANPGFITPGELTAAINALKGGASSAYDTLLELEQRFASDEAGVAALTTLVNSKASQSALDTHAANTTNPHSVTKAQVGLGSVPNVDATARANHTGTQAAGTITGLATVATSGAWSDLTGRPAGLYFNVKDYGALGDGTTDDRTAILAAVTAALAASGVCPSVFFPLGTYRVGAAGLTLSTAVKLCGASQSGSIIKLGASASTSVTLEEGTGGGTVFVNLNVGGCELSDLTIDANSNTTFASLVTGQTFDGLTMTRVTCKGAKYGAVFQSTSNLNVTGCKFTGNSLHQGFYQSVRAASNVKFMGCTFDPAGANAAAATASTCFWLQARVGSTGTYSGSSGSVKNFVFANNNLTFVGLGAVEVDGFVATADSTSAIRNLSIANNTILMTGTSTAAWGIEVNGAITYSCSGNTVTMDGGSGVGGIWANGNSFTGSTPARASVTGNTLRSTNGTGNAITCNNGAATISGNMCTGWAWSVSASTDSLSITGNTFDHTGYGSTRGINWATAGGNGAVISGNTFINASYAMSVTSASITNLNISSNHFIAANAGSYGVIFWSATSGSGNVINGNTFANNYTAANKYYQIGGFAAVNDNTPATFAALPAGGAGSQCVITDCTTATAGAAAAGGGSIKAIVWHDGTSWKVFSNTTSPTLVTPALGTPSSGVVTNLTYTPPGTGAVSRTIVSRFNETVSVKDFGAVGDGTTDDTAAIQAALNYANTGIRVNVYFPPGFYRTTATLSAPASYSILSGDGVEVSVIRCDLSVTPVIRIGNASGGAATFHSGIRDIKVTRDTGTVPNGSVGIDFNTFNYMLDFNVLCDRHAFGRVITSSAAGISIQYDCYRPLSTNMKTADFGIYNVAGVRVFGGELGMNGGETYDRTAHLIISGDANDVSFCGTGFLPRGPSVSKPAFVAFNSYLNATSLIRFVDCISENLAVVVQSDSGTPVVLELVFQGGRYSYDSTFWNYNAATTQKYSKLIGVQMSSIVSNSNVIVAPEVLTITGCQIAGNVNLVGGTNASVNMTGNTLVGSTTLSLNGAWTSLNVIGNNLISGTITDNATGTKVIANNSPASAWVTYTPTISAGAGSFTAASGTGRYKISGKSVEVIVQMTITTVGTGTYPRFTLPFACSSNGNRYPLNGKNASTGIVWSATVDPGATIVPMSRGHDNSGTVASGDVICAGGTYEIA